MGRTSKWLVAAGAILAVISLDFAEAAQFHRGDVNADGRLSVGDTLALCETLFSGAPSPTCLDASDSNDDGVVDISDGVYLLLHLFASGLPPPPPHDACGADPTGDGLGCLRYGPCESSDLPGLTLLGENAQGCLEYEHDLTGIVLVRVPAGTYLMGSPDDQCYRYWDEGPVHTVQVSGFLIGKYEVSQAEWATVMGENPAAHQPGRDGEYRIRAALPELLDDGGWWSLPVDSVSWDDIQAFENATGLRLPTEAQWEYACRAGTSTPYASGLCLDSELANYNAEFPSCESGCEPGTFLRSPWPVHAGAANSFGIHNMHGNVREWCEDCYDDKFYSSPEAAGPDPLRVFETPYRSARGGSWDIYAGDCRSAFRKAPNTAYREVNLGFRVVYALPPH